MEPGKPVAQEAGTRASDRRGVPHLQSGGQVKDLYLFTVHREDVSSNIHEWLIDTRSRYDCGTGSFQLSDQLVQSHRFPLHIGWNWYILLAGVL